MKCHAPLRYCSHNPAERYRSLHGVEQIRSIQNQTKINIPVCHAYVAKDQYNIGWEKMRRDHFSTQWYDEYEKEKRIRIVSTLVAKVIKTIYAHRRERWIERCSVAAEACQQKYEINNNLLDEQIRLVFSHFDEIDATDKQLLYKPIKSQFKMKPQSKLEWLQRIKRLIKTAVKQNTLITANTNNSILQYFKKKNNRENPFQNINHLQKHNTGRSQSYPVPNMKVRKENRRSP
jgi:hypothetical protein